MDASEECQCCGLTPCMHARVHKERGSTRRLVAKERYDALLAQARKLVDQCKKMRFVLNGGIPRLPLTVDDYADEFLKALAEFETFLKEQGK